MDTLATIAPAVPIGRKPRSKSLGVTKARVLTSLKKPGLNRGSSPTLTWANNAWEPHVYLRESPMHDWHDVMAEKYARLRGRTIPAPPAGDSSSTSAVPTGPPADHDPRRAAEVSQQRREQLIYAPETASPYCIPRKPCPQPREGGAFRASSAPSEMAPGVYELEGSIPAPHTAPSSRASSRGLSDASSRRLENLYPPSSTRTSHSSIAGCVESSPLLAGARPADTGGADCSTTSSLAAAATAEPPSLPPTPLTPARSPRLPPPAGRARASSTTVQHRRSFIAQRQNTLSLPIGSHIPAVPQLPRGITPPPTTPLPPLPPPPLIPPVPLSPARPPRTPAVPQPTTPITNPRPTTPTFPRRITSILTSSPPALPPAPAGLTSSTPLNTQAPPTPRHLFASKMAPTNTSSYASASSATTLNPAATYQHIQDMAAKRISTLDYLRKTHEGRVYWFNTLLFRQSDIQRLPSFQPPRLARRAANLLILGLSIPQALDANAHSAMDYVRSLNLLLSEFETYQSIHPPEGGTNSLSSGSFGRSKLPKIFIRGHSAGKARRASSATDIGLPLPPGFDSVVDTGNDTGSGTGTLFSTNPSAAGSSATLAGGNAGGSAVGGGSHASALPAPDTSLLLPGEEYTYLLTPSLPFEPDFFEVFATLSDALIDVYMRIAQLVSSPEKVSLHPGIAEAFAKADSRIRKVLVLGIVKEFEDATRAGTKTEMGGVGRVVLGGLT